MSQSLGRFQGCTREFVAILARELWQLGMRAFALAIYSDDKGIASAGFNKVIIKISDDLSAILGIIFKWQKDVVATNCMNFIGYEI